MTRTATIITAIIVVLIIALGLWLFMQPAATQDTGSPTTATAAQNEAAVRSTVASFGDKLKSVSLLSTSTVVADLGEQYGPYLSSDLLAQWEANPSLALGRVTSSPWPDSIEIDSVTQNPDNTYTVEGNVVEATNADTASTTPITHPITLTLAENGSVWVITKVETNQ